jgi:hypothetical protein
MMTREISEATEGEEGQGRIYPINSSCSLCSLTYIIGYQNAYRGILYLPSKSLNRSVFKRDQALANGVFGQFGDAVHAGYVHDLLPV